MPARALVSGAALIAFLLPGAPAMAGDDYGEGRNWIGGESKFAYVLVRKQQLKKGGGTRTDYSSTGSGDTEDFREARRLRDREDHDLLWVRLDGKRYVVRDASVLDELEEIHEPQRMLGEQQGLLGKQQGRLGEKQAELGGEQARLGARQGRLQSRQAMLSSELSRRPSSSRAVAIERELRDNAREQSEVGERQAELGELQAKLGEEQSELGRRQSELGRRQSDLAREIDRKVAELIRNAIEKGLGQPPG